MPKQFAYRDAHHRIYPAHPALAFQPGLVPGFYDTDTKVFTPQGNPQEQTGTIITDAGAGEHQKLLSGLSEDRGADTKPLGPGVAFTRPAESGPAVAELQAKIAELESQLDEERQHNAALEAQVAVLNDQLAARASDPVADGVTGAPDGDSAAGDTLPPNDPPSDADAPQDVAQVAGKDAPGTTTKRARKVT